MRASSVSAGVSAESVRMMSPLCTSSVTNEISIPTISLKYPEMIFFSSSEIRVPEVSTIRMPFFGTNLPVDGFHSRIAGITRGAELRLGLSAETAAGAIPQSNITSARINAVFFIVASLLNIYLVYIFIYAAFDSARLIRSGSRQCFRIFEKEYKGAL